MSEPLTRQGVRDLDAMFGRGKPAGRVVRGCPGPCRMRATGAARVGEVLRSDPWDILAAEWYEDATLREYRCDDCGATEWRE